MRWKVAVSCLVLAVCGWLAASPSARSEDRTPAQILKDIEAVELPKFDPSMQKDQKLLLKFLQDRQAAMGKRNELISELLKKDPANEELSRLLPERWQSLLMEKPKEVMVEINDYIAKGKNAEVKGQAYILKILKSLRIDNNADGALATVDEFLKAYPKDPRGPQILFTVANMLEDSGKQLTLLKRLVADFPDNPASKMAEGTIRQNEAVGKPFDLEFTDAIKGAKISMKDLKGKVVVVDFWATWCGPCVAEMPNMKKLYAEFKEKGVEFIGVSLDQPKEDGGLDKLKEYVAKNEIGWPQYYQGNGWESEFSTSWGITAIPAMFVVDTEGKLHSVRARGQLEKMIPELLKK